MSMKNFRAEDMPQAGKEGDEDVKVSHAQDSKQQQEQPQAQESQQPEQAQDQSQQSDQAQSSEESSQGEDSSDDEEDDEEVPSGTSREILDWVGDDQDRAQRALDTENASDRPRTTLVRDLNSIISG